MASNKRQEERNEKLLRQLIALPENRLCAECPAQGPSYANLFNSSFVCTRCSGILREFNHRVKSISASTFSADELKGLQENGNEANRQIWLAKFSHTSERLPDNNDLNAVKEFLRLKYVQKKWYDPNVQLKRIGTSNEGQAVPSITSNNLGLALPPPSSGHGRTSRQHTHVNLAVPDNSKSRNASIADDLLGGGFSIPQTNPANNFAALFPTASDDIKQSSPYFQSQQNQAHNTIQPPNQSNSFHPSQNQPNIMFNASQQQQQQQFNQPNLTAWFSMAPLKPQASPNFMQQQVPASAPMTVQQPNQRQQSDFLRPMQPVTQAASAPVQNNRDRYDVFREIDNSGPSIFDSSKTSKPPQQQQQAPVQQDQGGVFGAQYNSGLPGYSGGLNGNMQQNGNMQPNFTSNFGANGSMSTQFPNQKAQSQPQPQSNIAAAPGYQGFSGPAPAANPFGNAASNNPNDMFSQFNPLLGQNLQNQNNKNNMPAGFAATGFPSNQSPAMNTPNSNFTVNPNGGLPGGFQQPAPPVQMPPQNAPNNLAIDNSYNPFNPFLSNNGNQAPQQVPDIGINPFLSPFFLGPGQNAPMDPSVVPKQQPNTDNPFGSSLTNPFGSQVPQVNPFLGSNQPAQSFQQNQNGFNNLNASPFF